MITEDFVSREVAKLLKEKGFHEPVRYEYHYYNTTPSFHRHLRDFNSQAYDSLQSIWYSAPTIQMTMKWLREKYNLEIYPYHSINSKWWFEIIKCLNSVAEYESDIEFDTYEQACEEAIQYCLKNII